jgi:hypothetical protein
LIKSNFSPTSTFWKGKLCKFIKWETLNFGGKLKIKIDKKFIEADISELTN